MFGTVNLWAIPVAAIAGFLVGGPWYGVLGTSWMKAAGLDEEDVQGGSFLPFVLAALADLVMASVLFVMLAASRVLISLSGYGIADGLFVALLVWSGFVVTTLSVNNAFQMKPLMLTLIDAGHWLAVLLVMGAVLGAFYGG